LVNTKTSKSEEALLNEHQAAELLNVSVQTMRRRRLFRQPPEWVKIGSSVRYRRESIQRLIQNGEQHVEAAN